MPRNGIILLTVGMAFLVAWWILTPVRPDLSVLKEWIAALASWRNDYPLSTGAVFFLLFLSLTALSLPLGMWLSLAAGALFGFVPGTILAVTASGLGATLAMLGSRYLFRHKLRLWMSNSNAPHRRKWLLAIERGFVRDGWMYLLSLRLLPILPFFAVNLVIGLTRMPARVFLLVSLIGIAPLTAIFVWTGTKLAKIQRLSDLISGEMVAVLAMLAALPWITRLLLKRKGPPPHA